MITLRSEIVDELRRWYDVDAVEAIMAKLCTPPSQTTIRCNTLATTAKELMDHLNSKFKYDPVRKRAFRIHESVPDLVVIDCEGPNELRSDYPIVVVGKSCGEAVLRGSNVFLRGILGAGNHNLVSIGMTVSLWADLSGQVRHGEAINEIRPCFKFVGNGVTTVNRALLLSQGDGLGVRMTEQIFVNPPLQDLNEGKLMFLQNLPSVLVGHILDPQPGETVLDMCSAPGGKTSHCAALMKNVGRIIAIDRAKNKIQEIERNAARLGVTIIAAHAFDSTKLLDSGSRSPLGNPPIVIDRILLDPPCSGLGNRPRFEDDITLSNLQGFSDYQQKLVDVAVGILKVGGCMTYSTCTINPKENEGIVEYILSKYGDSMKLCPVPERFCLGLNGLTTSKLNDEERKMVQRFDPGHSRTDTIGFFIAKFNKVA